MSDLLPFVLFLPVVLPLALGLLVLALPWRKPRSWLVLLGLLAAAVPLLPLAGLPRETPPLPWMALDDRSFVVQLSHAEGSRAASGSIAFMLLIAAALGLWSEARLDAAHPSEDSHPVNPAHSAGRVAVAGALLAIGSAQLGVLATVPLLAALGAGAALAGTLIVDLHCARPNHPALRGDLLPRAFGVTLLTVAIDPRAAWSGPLWLAGCLLILAGGIWRLSVSRESWGLQGTVEVAGLTPLAVYLLLAWTGRGSGFAEGETGASPWILGAGAAAFLLGAVNAVTSRTLRSLLAAQWAAQLGLLLVMGALAARGAIDAIDVFAAALNGVVSMLVLCLAVGRLAHIAGTEEIAGLPILRTLPRRFGLAYLLAAASAAGMPFTLGFSIRQTLMAAASPAYLRPLLLAGSTLLLLALAVPLAVFFRSAASETRQPAHVDERWGVALLLGLLLAVLSPFRWFATLVGVEVAASSGSLVALPQATAGLVVVLLVMAFVNRATKHGASEAAFPIDGEVGWALPLSALGDQLALLTPGPWLRGSHRVAEWSGRAAARIVLLARPIALRYYLGVMVAMAVAIVALVAGGGAP